MDNRKPKLVFFDMEGTLFREVGTHYDGTRSVSAWPLLAEKMGPKANAAETENYKKWKRGEYSSYIPWMQDTSTVFKQEGLTRKFFYETIESIPYVPGVKETFDMLHKSGVQTGIITGGFHEHAQRVVRDCGVHHVYASCKFFWDEEGSLSHWEFEEYGLEGKVVAAREIAARHGVPLEDCAFVGDGSNDVHVARAVGVSIAFNGDKELQDVATHCVTQDKGKEDFRAVLEYLLPYEYSGGPATARA